MQATIAKAHKKVAKSVWKLYHQFYRLAFPGRLRAHQRRFWKSEKGRLAQRRKNKSVAGIARRKRYWATLKGKLARRRYNKSRKGRAADHRYITSPHGRMMRCQKVSRYRAHKMRSIVNDVAAIKQIYARAQELRQWFDVVVDHIVPLVKGGAHSPENLQIIYKHENAVKQARLDYVPSVVFR